MCADPWQSLDLFHNQIGHAGVAALAKVIAEGAMPKLEEVDVYGNPGGSAGREGNPVDKALRERRSA